MREEARRTCIMREDMPFGGGCSVRLAERVMQAKGCCLSRDRATEVAQATLDRALQSSIHLLSTSEMNWDYNLASLLGVRTSCVLKRVTVSGHTDSKVLVRLASSENFSSTSTRHFLPPRCTVRAATQGMRNCNISNGKLSALICNIRVYRIGHSLRIGSVAIKGFVLN